MALFCFTFIRMGVKTNIFEIDNDNRFLELALEIFRFQHAENTVYRSFCDLLNCNPSEVHDLADIPFLPIEFFRTHRVVTTESIPKLHFRSSGTTSINRSSHHIIDEDLYVRSFILGFEKQYGNPSEYIIIALLPNYLEQPDSSLVYMVDKLIQLSRHSMSGFYKDDLSQLANRLKIADQSGKKVLLLGVTFALLNLVEAHTFQLQNTIVMETGGMKGMRRELVREELHQRLKSGFGVDQIHSEYGMTELLSQAYSTGNGQFITPPWMKILIRDPEDPFTELTNGKSGGINIIDLANYYSCAFIATQDLGKIHSDGSFEVLGRFDHADIRGCNLMAF